MSDAILSVEGLNSFYGRAHILFDVTLEVRRGEVVALLGPQRRRKIHHDAFHHGAGRQPERTGPLRRP